MPESSAVAGRQLSEAGISTGQRKRIAVERSAVRNVAGEHSVHDVSTPGHHTQGDAATHRLTKCGEIGHHSEMLLSASGTNSKACDHLIENQQSTVLRRKLANSFEVFVLGQKTSAVAK